MICVGSKLYIGDNSGCKKVKCIKVLGNGIHRCGQIGDFLIVSVLQIKKNKRLIEKHEVRKALIIRSKKKIFRKSGLSLSFLNNVVILIDNTNNPVGNRIIGSVTQELRKKKLMKILSLASSIV